MYNTITDNNFKQHLEPFDLACAIVCYVNSTDAMTKRAPNICIQFPAANVYNFDLTAWQMYCPYFHKLHKIADFQNSRKS